MPGLDCVSVLECARTRPLEFLASVVSVLEDENSSREQICMAVVVSRSAFTVEAMGLDPEPSELFERYIILVKNLMDGTDEDIQYHAAVSYGVYAEYFLTVEAKTTILSEICQFVADGNHAYLISLNVIVREMNIGPTGARMAVSAVLTMFRRYPNVDIKLGLDVVANVIEFLAKNTDFSEIWAVLIHLMDTHFEDCIVVLTSSLRWQLKRCGLEMLSETVKKSIEHGLQTPSSRVQMCQFVLKISELFPQLFAADVLPAALQMAIQVIDSDDLDVTEEADGSWGIALVKSLLSIDHEVFTHLLLTGIDSNSISQYLASTLTYLLVDGDIFHDLRVILYVVQTSVRSRPRVVIIGLELIQLLVERGAPIPQAEFLEMCQQLLTVDYASVAASVAFFAIVQTMDVKVDVVARDLLQLSSHASSFFASSTIVDLITLLLPSMNDVIGFCTGVLQLIESRMNVIKDTEVMSSFCYLFIEAMKVTVLPDDMMTAIINLYLALQTSEENCDCGLKCLGRMIDLFTEKLSPILVPIMNRVMVRAAEFESKWAFESALFVWRALIRAKMTSTDFVLPMQEILIQATESSILENRILAFENMALNLIFFPSLLFPILDAVERSCVRATRSNTYELMLPVLKCFSAIMKYPNHSLTPDAVQALQFVIDEVDDCPELQELYAQMSRHTITFTHCTAVE